MASGFVDGSINLEEAPPVFYAGQVVSGTVVFNLNQPLTFSALNLQFLGEANVLWSEYETETVNGIKSQKKVNYEGREEYFNFNQVLAGGIGGMSQLPAGRQAFHFKYQIPFSVPSSFDGELGKISYRIIATLIYPPGSVQNEDLVKEFNVIAPLDLNMGSPQIKQPIDFEFEDEYGCGFCCIGGNSPITIRIRLPASGFCPGQAIPVAIEAHNESNTEITKIIFEIVSREKYHSQRPMSENIPPEQVLVTVKTRPVMGHTKRNFTCDVMVPELIAPNLERCGIIDIGYFFRVTVKFSGCSDDVTDESEICLGLVPLKELVEAYVHPMSHSLPKVAIPIDNGQQVVYTNAPLNTSIQSSQYTPVSSPPPPYPGNNTSYPVANMGQIPISDGKPGYGFKLPESNVLPYPNYGSPYPGVSQPPYPVAQGNVTSLPAYNPGSFTPSAPPPL